MWNANYAQRLPVSPSAQKPPLASWWTCPWPPSGTWRGSFGTRPDRLHGPMKELEQAGLISSAKLGGSALAAKPAARWFFTDPAIKLFGELLPTRHEEGNRSVLLERFPAPDWFYRVAAEITHFGKCEGFLWLDDVCIDAAVLYENGWVVLCWSGMLQTREDLHRRFNHLGQDIPAIGVNDQHPWPAMLAFVVPDLWQREQVMRAARQTYFDRNVSIWSVSDGSRTDAVELMPCRGWVDQQTHSRDIGGWPWASRVQASIWSQPHAPSLYRVFRTIAEFPGMPVELARQELN